MASLDLASLVVSIKADVGDAVSGIEQVNSKLTSIENTTKEVVQSNNNAAKQFGDSWTETASKLVLVDKYVGSMGKSLTNFFKEGVQGASDLSETVSKTQQIFKSSSDEILDWSENAIGSMGMAQNTALTMASTFGDLATSIGLTESSATEMSMNLTQLAADLASFKNIGVDQAAQALQGIFTGNAQSLKSLGIVMNEATLSAYALSQGITTSLSAMSETEKVALRYQYVLQATANAQGDFQRTSSGLANEQRILSESVDSLRTSLGETLLPLMEALTGIAADIVQAIDALPDGIKAVVTAVGIATAAFLVAIPVVLALNAALTALGVTLSGGTLLLIAGITAAVAGIATLISGLVSLRDDATDTDADMKRLFKTIDDNSVKKVGIGVEIDTPTQEAVNGIISGIDDLFTQSDEELSKITCYVKVSEDETVTTDAATIKGHIEGLISPQAIATLKEYSAGHYVDPVALEKAQKEMEAVKTYLDSVYISLDSEAANAFLAELTQLYNDCAAIMAAPLTLTIDKTQAEKDLETFENSVKQTKLGVPVNLKKPTVFDVINYKKDVTGLLGVVKATVSLAKAQGADTTKLESLMEWLRGQEGEVNKVDFSVTDLNNNLPEITSNMTALAAAFADLLADPTLNLTVNGELNDDIKAFLNAFGVDTDDNIYSQMLQIQELFSGQDFNVDGIKTWTGAVKDLNTELQSVIKNIRAAAAQSAMVEIMRIQSDASLTPEEKEARSRSVYEAAMKTDAEYAAIQEKTDNFTLEGSTYEDLIGFMKENVLADTEVGKTMRKELGLTPSNTETEKSTAQKIFGGQSATDNGTVNYLGTDLIEEGVKEFQTGYLGLLRTFTKEAYELTDKEKLDIAMKDKKFERYKTNARNYGMVPKDMTDDELNNYILGLYYQQPFGDGNEYYQEKVAEAENKRFSSAYDNLISKSTALRTDKESGQTIDSQFLANAIADIDEKLADQSIDATYRKALEDSKASYEQMQPMVASAEYLANIKAIEDLAAAYKSGDDTALSDDRYTANLQAVVAGLGLSFDAVGTTEWQRAVVEQWGEKYGTGIYGEEFSAEWSKEGYNPFSAIQESADTTAASLDGLSAALADTTAGIVAGSVPTDGQGQTTVDTMIEEQSNIDTQINGDYNQYDGNVYNGCTFAPQASTKPTVEQTYGQTQQTQQGLSNEIGP